MNNFATFQPKHSNYLPANKKAIGLCEELKRMELTMTDIVMLRAMGHDCRLTNGQPIGVIEIWA